MKIRGGQYRRSLEGDIIQDLKSVQSSSGFIIKPDSLLVRPRDQRRLFVQVVLKERLRLGNGRNWGRCVFVLNVHRRVVERMLWSARRGDGFYISIFVVVKRDDSVIWQFLSFDTAYFVIGKLNSTVFCINNGFNKSFLIRRVGSYFTIIFNCGGS